MQKESFQQSKREEKKFCTTKKGERKNRTKLSWDLKLRVKWKWKCWSLSGVRLWLHGLQSLPGSSVHGDFPSKNTGVGSHSILQGIFQTQELNQDLVHCTQILYQMSYQESPNKGQDLYFSITELCFYLQLHTTVVETQLWSLQDKLNQFKLIFVGSQFPTFLFPPWLHLISRRSEGCPGIGGGVWFRPSCLLFLHHGLTLIDLDCPCSSLPASFRMSEPSSFPWWLAHETYSVSPLAD